MKRDFCSANPDPEDCPVHRLAPRPVILLAGLSVALAIGWPMPGYAAAKKGIRLWNLTGETLNSVELAPAGTTAWGRDQCQNDKDGEVDFDEQLPITDVVPGSYDVRVRDATGRTCIARKVEVKADAVFTIHEKDLTACTR
jgi:hypothetical protein